MGDTTAMNTRDTAAYSGGTVIAIRSAATTFRQRFAGGMRMTVRSSSVVHAVSQQKWLAGELVPVPLCHIGVYGLDFNSVHPTRLSTIWENHHRSPPRGLILAPHRRAAPTGARRALCAKRRVSRFAI